MIRQVMLIINVSGKAILRNTFVRCYTFVSPSKIAFGFGKLKLHFLLIICGAVFILQRKDPC